jgi:aconitase A
MKVPLLDLNAQNLPLETELTAAFTSVLGFLADFQETIQQIIDALGDTFDFIDLQAFAPDTQLTLQITHSNGQSEQIKVNHTYNASQIEWFRAGSALNLIKLMEA